jgi:zinc/manganese transport system substrate-binding protein
MICVYVQLFVLNVMSAKIQKTAFAAAFMSLFLMAGRGQDAPANPGAARLNIVAAENFYGGVARQIAGNSANVISIISSPVQDPHDFATDAATARAVADADIVIYNGAGYDTWMSKLLAVQGRAGRIVIQVSDLIGAKPGDNPHIWYDPRTMSALADKLAEILKQPDNLAAFKKQMDALNAKIAGIKSVYGGTPVTATEPVFGRMAAELGFKMSNNDFQVSVMNDTEPGFRETADFEKSLKDKSVKILFYNSQVTNPTTQRMLEIATESGVPIIGVTETQPPDAGSYVDWMLSQLNKVQSTLETSH